jgi:hypothetical protein
MDTKDLEPLMILNVNNVEGLEGKYLVRFEYGGDWFFEFDKKKKIWIDSDLGETEIAKAVGHYIEEQKL